MWFAHPGSKIYQNLCQNCGRNAIFRAIPCGEKFFGPVEFTSFWGFFTPKRAPGAPNGGLRGQLRVIWVQGKREHPAIKKKLGGKIFFPEMVLDPLSHSLLKVKNIGIFNHSVTQADLPSESFHYLLSRPWGQVGCQKKQKSSRNSNF